MGKYRLPERFGGEEVEVLDGSIPVGLVLVRAAGGALFAFDRGLLQHDGPPEPAHLTTWRQNSTGDVWQRDDSPEQNRTVMRGRHWFRAGDSDAYTYEQALKVIGDEGWTQLIPDPVASAPELPYKVLDGATSVKVLRSPEGWAHIEIYNGGICVGASLDHEHAPRVAAAILAAPVGGLDRPNTTPGEIK